jgi:MurNAc alpha-1-phosphate uridylyltransferase
LKKARPLLGEDPIWIANTDSVWLEAHDGAAMKNLASIWAESDMDAALLLARMDRSMGFDSPGDFFMDDAHRLTFRGDAPATPFAFMGVHITRPSIIDGIAEDAFSLSKIWRALAPQGRLKGAVLDGDWMHVGDPAARDAAEARFKVS